MEAHLPDDFARMVLENAWGFRQAGDVLPTWFLVADQLQVVGTPFTGPETKHAAALVVADMVREARCEVVAFVTDAWVRQVPVGTAWDEGPPPSEAADAVECLTVNVWERSGASWALMRRYRQRDDGSLEVLDESTSTNSDDVGTFAPVVAALREAR